MWVPLLLGALVKGYDDAVDTGMALSPVVMASLQSVMVALFTLTAYHDFYFSVACFVLCLCPIGLDHPFWKSLLPVAGLLTLIALPFAGEQVGWKLLATGFALIVFVGMSVAESRLFPEETSREKIAFRSILFVCLSVALLLPYEVLLPTFSKEPIRKTLWILWAYFGVSVYSMLTQLSRQKPVQPLGASSLQAPAAEVRQSLHATRDASP